MNTEKIEGEVNEIYLRLEALRQQYGKAVEVALGQRDVFCHHASLNITEQDAKNAEEIFSEADQGLEVRHHPFFAMLGMLGRCETQELRLLPGESYAVYQDHDDEVAVVVRGTLPSCSLTVDQVRHFMRLYGVNEKHSSYGDFVGLMGSL